MPTRRRSSRRSTSVLDIPVTPLLEPSPGHENPFNEEDEAAEGPPHTPSLPQEPEGRRKKKGFACAGIAVLGLVIIGALILVAVKQSLPKEVTERQRDSTTSKIPSTTSTITTTTTLPTQPPDQFQSKLVTLYQLVSKCKEMMVDDKEFDCEAVLVLATAYNIDTLVQELTARVQDAKYSKDLASLYGILDIVDKLRIITPANQISYSSIMAGLEPVLLQNDHDHPVNTSLPDRREGEDNSKVVGGLIVYQPTEEVACDRNREMRCRDKTACYPKEKHCDFNVDCEDNSDEDSCSCVDRLVDDRLCDAFTDCKGGGDEADCGCEEGQYFCAPDPAWGPPECIKEEGVCDGQVECSNGRDEQDCYILGESRDTIGQDTASSNGILAMWRQNVSSYLPVVVGDISGEAVLDICKAACAGIAGSQPSFTTATMSGEYAGKVALMEAGQQVLEMDGAGQKFVDVSCGDKTCGVSSARNKREVGRVKRDNTYNEECNEKLASMNHEKKEAFMSSDDYAKECSKGETDAKIVGGEVSYPDSWPYTVALYRDGQFICGATLVSPDWIITAGHCLFGYSEGMYYTIRAGMVRRQSQSPWEQIRYLVEVFIYPGYDNTFLRHDVALARLNTPVYNNRHVQSICLPHDANMYPASGSTCMATGWGDLSEDGPSSELLREVEVPILAKCGRSYNNVSYQICGGFAEGGKDACQGDSGGPLYCMDSQESWYLGGVISHGRGCARAEEAGVYVRLAYYMEWVRQVMSGVVPAVGQPRQECGGVKCGSGECVPSKWVCDKTVDCLDGGDVLGCVTLDNGTRVQVLEEVATAPESSIMVDESDEFLSGLVSLSDVFIWTSVTCDEDQFKCSSLEQCVPARARCDGARDCPDWSDEMDCRCGELVDLAKVCDGVADCRDQSDEVECDMCGEEEWRCPLSGECVEAGTKCDTYVDCRWGEDERYCTALTEDSYLSLSPTGDIIPNHQGMLLINQKQEWKPVCAAGFSNSLAKNICQYMGWTGSIKYGLVPPADSPLNASDIVATQVQRRSATNCFHVNMECEEDICGERPMYRNLQYGTTPPLSGPGSWPWHANIFNEGEYICGGTILHRRFVLTDISCAKMVVQSGTFITVFVGQEKRTNVGLSPYSQVRRVVSLKVVQGTTMVLAQMDKEFDFNEQVNQLCLPEDNMTPISCVLSGMSGDMWTKTLETSVAKCSSNQLCLTTSPNQGVSTMHWSGALACANPAGRYYAVGVYHSDSVTPPDRVNIVISSKLKNVITSALVAPTPDLGDTCQGFRCRLGTCIKEEEVCDKTWDCREGEDEEDCPVVGATSLALCKQVRSGAQCTCPSGQLKCGNNLCLARVSWCNGVSECGDGTDEPAECNDCATKLSILTPSAVCDTVSDCDDSSDETGQACGCGENTFRCDPYLPFNMSSCIPASALCDGLPDCSEGTDELPALCLSLATMESVQQDSLLLPASSSVGYLKVRTYGVWYTYCAEAWSDSASSSICSTLGWGGAVSWAQMEAVQQVVELGSVGQVQNSSCTTIFITCSQN